MMKKTMAFLLAVIMLAATLAGCGNADTNPNTGNLEQPPTTSTTPTTPATPDDPADPTDPVATEPQVHYSQGLEFKPIKDTAGEVEGYAVSGVGTCNTREIRIPDTHNGLLVMGIWAWAFQDLEWLTRVVIPDSVEWIEGQAFDNCPNLEKLEIPDSVTAMADLPVRNCPKAVETVDGVTYVDKWLIHCDQSVTEVNIRPDTVGIAAFAFSGGLDGGFEGLTSIVIPDSVKYLGDNAFEKCLGLKSVTLSDGIRTIPWRAFYWCTSLENITIPDGVTEIGEEAFASCGALVNVQLPEGLEHIGKLAFASCASLEEMELPDTVTTVGYGAFSGCLALKRVKLSAGLTAIMGQTFSNCGSLEAIDVPEGVTDIQEGAFYCCASLRQLLLPESLTTYTMSFGAFEWCSPEILKLGSGITTITEGMLCRSHNLEHIYYNGTQEAWEAVYKDPAWLATLSGCTIHCTDGDIVVG